MEDFKFYEVGGKIRDELLGLTNKDVDYVAVPTKAVYSKIHPYETRNMTDFDNNSILNLFIVPAAPLWAFSIGLLLVTTDRLVEVNKYNNERRRISQEA